MTGIPSWFRKDKEEGIGVAEEMPPLPTEATLPDVPNFSEADEDTMIFGRAAVILEGFKRERLQLQQEIESLKIQLTEALLGHDGNSKKVAFLELENVQLRNDIQTLQTDLHNMREMWSKVRAVLEHWGVKPPEKKPRKKKEKKPESTDEHIARDIREGRFPEKSEPQ